MIWTMALPLLSGAAICWCLRDANRAANRAEAAARRAEAAARAAREEQQRDAH